MINRLILMFAFAFCWVLPTFSQVPPESKIYVTPMLIQGMKGGGATDSDLGPFIIGQIMKQHLPLIVVTDDKQADFIMIGQSASSGKSLSARDVFGWRVHYREEYNGAVSLVNEQSTAVVWATTGNKGELDQVARKIVERMKCDLFAHYKAPK